MEFSIYSRSGIENIEPLYETQHIIISITTTIEDVADLPICEQTIGVLRLSFLDSDGGANSITNEQADSIRNFIVGLKDRFGRVIVHCDAGWSRSPAVAAALAKHFNNDDAEFFTRYRPNMLVYRKVLDAFNGS